MLKSSSIRVGALPLLVERPRNFAADALALSAVRQKTSIGNTWRDSNPVLSPAFENVGVAIHGDGIGGT